MLLTTDDRQTTDGWAIAYTRSLKIIPYEESRGVVRQFKHLTATLCHVLVAVEKQGLCLCRYHF